MASVSSGTSPTGTCFARSFGSSLVFPPKPREADNVGDEDRGEPAGGDHSSGTPPLRVPSRTGSSCARQVGLSLLPLQAGRARGVTKAGLSAGRRRLRPMSSSDRKEPPLSRHPLQEGGAVIAKAQAGAGDQVLDRA